MADDYTLKVQIQSNINELENDIKNLKDLAANIDVNFNNNGAPKKEDQLGDDLLEFAKMFSEGTLEFVEGVFSFQKIGKKTWTDLIDQLLDFATSSQLTDSSTREQMFTYGLNAKENWALNEVMGAMGISSIEDLMWMDDNQINIFNDSMSRMMEFYENYAEGNSDLLNSVYEFNVEWQILKKELLGVLLEIISDEEFKEVITDAMTWVKEHVPEIVEFLREVGAWLGKFLGSVLGEKELITAEEAYSRSNIGSSSSNILQQDQSAIDRIINNSASTTNTTINITADGSKSSYNINSKDMDKLINSLPAYVQQGALRGYANGYTRI